MFIHTITTCIHFQSTKKSHQKFIVASINETILKIYIEQLSSLFIDDVRFPRSNLHIHHHSFQVNLVQSTLGIDYFDVIH